MKRVKAACITQTLHFLLKEDIGRDYAIKLVKPLVRRIPVGAFRYLWGSTLDKPFRMVYQLQKMEGR